MLATAKYVKFLVFFLPAVRTAYGEDIEASITTEIPGQEQWDNAASNKYLSEEYFAKAYTYIRNSPAFKHKSKEELKDLLNELETWEPPERLSKSFPYYLAGYDAEDRPVWVNEGGKYNLRAEVERGKENVDLVMKYLFQSMHRIVKSIYDRDTPEKEVRHAVFLSDLDGFDMTQYTNRETIAFILQIAKDYKEVTEEVMGRMVLINVSHIVRVGLDVFRPILGRIVERIEVFGTNKAKWIPKIRRLLPDEAIPPWYGGDKNFKPVQIYG